MSQSCSKFCTPEEIRQMRETMKPGLLTQVAIGSFTFNERTEENDIQKVIATNIKTKAIGKPFVEEKLTYVNEEEYIEREGYKGAKLVEAKNTKEKIGKEESEKKFQYNVGNEYQGGLGEYFADRVAVEVLGYKLIHFDKCLHGIDGIYVDKEGNIIVAEHKFTTDKNGSGSLKGSLNPDPPKRGENPNYKEGTMRWLEIRLSKMMTQSEEGPDKELYSDTNREVAKEIIKAIKEGRCRRELIHIHSQTLNIVVSRFDDNEKVKPFLGLEYAKK